MRLCPSADVSLVRTRAVPSRGGGLGEKPASLSELPFRPALAVTPLPFGVVNVDRLFEGQADLHAVEAKLLLQVFSDVPVGRPTRHETTHIGRSHVETGWTSTQQGCVVYVLNDSSTIVEGAAKFDETRRAVRES